MTDSPRARIMWVDLNISVRRSELPVIFSEYFDIVRPHRGSSLESEIGRLQPHLLLFDFDYPERPGLKLMESTKRLFPSLPILMLTLQHSESLAVWAFRARVWDYIVKPPSQRELDRCLSAMNKLVSGIHEQRRKRDIRSKTSPLPAESRVSPRSTTPTALMPALAYIEKHFRSKVSSANVSKACGMDSFQFSRAFKSSFGITFKEYLMRVRIKEACRLLERPDIAVTEVAYLCGFNDPSYFSKVFKCFAGVTPSDYASSMENRGILSDERLSILI